MISDKDLEKQIQQAQKEYEWKSKDAWDDKVNICYHTDPGLRSKYQGIAATSEAQAAEKFAHLLYLKGVRDGRKK